MALPKWVRAWFLLNCLQTIGNAFLLSFDKAPRPRTRHLQSGGPTNVDMCPNTSRSGIHCLNSSPFDDDDISQHERMMELKDDSAGSEEAQRKTSGYRRIEDWHEETVSKNPKQVLIRLKQEKAMWDKKFEDLGGDGI